jgi:hypothetical protein
MLQLALRPLGFGSTHSRAGPSVPACGPMLVRRLPKAIRYAVTPATAT